MEPLEGAGTDPETKKWWAKHPEAWIYCTRDQQPPQQVMDNFLAWLEDLPPRPVFVGYPASYDQMFAHWYLIKFTGKDPIGFSGLDIKTLASAHLGIPFRQISKRAMPKHWFRAVPPHTHTPLQDAIGQGILLLNILKDTSLLQVVAEMATQPCAHGGASNVTCAQAPSMVKACWPCQARSYLQTRQAPLPPGFFCPHCGIRHDAPDQWPFTCDFCLQTSRQP